MGKEQRNCMSCEEYAIGCDKGCTYEVPTTEPRPSLSKKRKNKKVEQKVALQTAAAKSREADKRLRNAVKESANKRQMTVKEYREKVLFEDSETRKARAEAERAEKVLNKHQARRQKRIDKNKSPQK